MDAALAAAIGDEKGMFFLDGVTRARLRLRLRVSDRVRVGVRVGVMS